MDYLALFMLGLFFGSFFNVCIYRLPENKSLGGRSYCRKCQAKIAWYHNIPVLSFFYLRGKCHQCHEPIGWQYPLVEVCTGLLFSLILWRQDRVIDLLLIKYLVFFSILFVISVIDYYHYIIPDILSLGGAVVGLLFSVFPLSDVALLDSFLGGLIGGGLFFLVAYLFEKITKREGLGGGDVKLLGMLGAFLGLRSILPVVITSSLLGTTLGVALLWLQKKEIKSFIPFGPFLSVGAFLYYFFQEVWLRFLYPNF